MTLDQSISPSDLPADLRFLAGGGEAARLIRARDWTGHPLGEPGGWPDILKSNLSTVLNSPESLILAWGRDELTFFFNDTYAPLLGPRVSWAMGAPFREVWADAWAQAKPIIENAFAGRSQRYVDLPWKLDTDRGDADTWFSFSYSRVLDAAGEVTGLFILTNETTARVLAEAAQRETEETLRLVTQSAKDHVIFTTDPGGIITTWSAGATGVLGWTEEEAIGQSASMIFTPEDRAQGADVREMLGAARDGCATDERWHLRKDDARVFLNGSVHPLLPDAQGNERGFIKIARDETARRHADQRLAHAMETQRLSLQQMPGFAAILAGPDHVFQYVNDAYVAISGPRQFLGQGVRAVFPELEDQGFFDLLDQVYTTDEPFSGRAMPIQLGGESELRHIDLLFQPIRDDAGAVVGIFVGGYDVTDRLRTEEQLRQSEVRYRQIVEGAEDFAIITLDPSGAVTAWNAGAERITGYPEAEVTGRPGALIFTPEDRDAGAPDHELNRANDEGRAVNERWHQRKDGTRFWGSGLTMRLEGGKGFLKIFRDRTAEHEAEASMRASEARFRLMADAVPQIVWITDPEGRTEFFNKQWTDYTGAAYEPSTAAAIAASFVHPDDAPATVEAFDEARRTGGTFLVEHRIRSRSGEYRWFLVRGEPHRHPETGQIERWFGASVDVHDRKIAEGALRALNADLEREVVERVRERGLIWQNSLDLLSVIDLATGRFDAVSPAWTTSLGWSADELQGHSYADFVSPEDADASGAALEQVRSGNPLQRFENRYRSKEGQWRWLSWVAVPENGKLYSVTRDITEEKERQAELEGAQEQLRQAQKMEAVGQLTGGLAHDFNNLLTGMMGNLELLAVRLQRGKLEDADRFIMAAQGAGRRAASLTQRLLAFSRRQTLDPKPTDVNRLVFGMEDLLRRTVGPATDIEVVGAAGLWTAMIDAGQLENAVLNLCINARDAMPDGGRITIETANKWLDERAARERELPPGQYLSLCVTDTGTGMSAETLERAFEPFYTTKPIGEGTGLGLSMVYGFARQSNGQVRIYSELGRGTTVCVYLPRYLGDALLAEEEEAIAAATAANGETILVVDDEATIRHLIDEVLGEAGYTVIGAPDGSAGLKVLQSGARIELLITDVGLPNGMNGRQVADAARALRPGLKVLFITGYAENAAVGNGHLDPGMELLTKPFTMEALEAKVADMMRSGRKEPPPA